ncbi:alpha-tectorin [Kryptolebias marmoratus]|uniref:Alpha-tectorin-like n=1 Tax=Kryptolebias marmoratus TaxID=37003 RepID=A0A3Q3EU02_KRYMA|nr:alpha-tectorin [Kryptolebias marmoratus]
MLKSGALLLHLAVAACQFKLHLSETFTGSGEVDISSCPLTYLGRQYTAIRVSLNDSSFMMCSVEDSPDCLKVEGSQGERVSVEILFEETKPGSFIHQARPNINSSSPCLLKVQLQDETNGTYLTIITYNFGHQGVQLFNITNLYNQTHVNLSAVIGNTSAFSLFLNTSEVEGGLILDVSGCRTSDVILFSGSSRFVEEECLKISCSSAAELRVDSTCGPTEVCRRNFGCAPRPSVCSVTGSTVIDFLGRVHAVTNRCVYRLVQGANFQLLAGFQERRRQNVMFLDHLILQLEEPDVVLYLGQGGHVEVNNETLDLDATVQLVHGMALSKDRTGVTAEVPSANITIYFDGNTLHVAGTPSAVEGLCGDPGSSSQTTTLSAEISSFHSLSGCEVEFTDTSTDTTDCNATTEHCSLLKQHPFFIYNLFIDPEPYITACTNILCNYPMVDGLRCQFMEAYTKTCDLQSGNILGDWRPAVSCPSVPEPNCLDRYCSDHEFCGEEDGQTRCMCRALFASNYRAANTLGEPAVCTQDSASVTLIGCLLEDRGVDLTSLHLQDKTCKGQVDSETHMVTFHFDLNKTCGMRVVTNESQIIYQNTIMSGGSLLDGVIYRHSQVLIDFSCYFERPAVNTVAFKVKDSSVVLKVVSGFLNYTLMMNAYTDPDRTQLVDPTSGVELNQKVWVELAAEGLDDAMVAIVIDSCWATSQPSLNGSLKHELISDGCPNSKDRTVEMNNNGAGTSASFSFSMFQFIGSEDGVNLHCKLKLCIKQGNSCTQVCGRGRTRRSIRRQFAEMNPALISLTWTL